MNTAITKRRPFKATLEAAMPSISDALPSNIPAEKFQRIAMFAINNIYNLDKCANDDPSKVLNALLQCANDGLLPDNREATMVAFSGKKGWNLTYIPMIGGLLKRLQQSGEVLSVTAEVVHENDSFDYQLGDNPFITHKPLLGDRGKMIAAYSIIRMKDGGIYREVMSREAVLKVKKVSRANNGPWSGPFEGEMWRKTVLRRGIKKCPVSSEIVDLFKRDDGMYDLQSDPTLSPKTRIQERLGTAPKVEEPTPAEPVEPQQPTDEDIIEAEVINEQPSEAPEMHEESGEADIDTDAAREDDPSQEKPERSAILATMDVFIESPNPTVMGKIWRDHIKTLKTSTQVMGFWIDVQEHPAFMDATDDVKSWLQSAVNNFVDEEVVKE